MTRKSVLIVFSEISGRIFFVPLQVTEEQFQMLEQWNGEYINSGTPFQEDMTEFFYNDKGKFKYPHQNSPMFDHFDMIIHCGMYI